MLRFWNIKNTAERNLGTYSHTFKLRSNVRLYTLSHTMKLPSSEAEALINNALQNLGYSAEDAPKITHHLIDSELRGYPSAGLARVLSIADHLKTRGRSQSKIEITRELPATAQIDGHDTLGYLVGHTATQLAIEKAKKVGVAVVGANNTWYTG